MASDAKCRLILDSCCDLPRHILDDEGVEFFRFPFNMNDGEHLDDLWQTMKPKEFYDRLRAGEVSSTAQIPIPVLEERFEAAAQEGTPTVYLAFTAGLSGTYDTAKTLAQQVRERHPGFELYTVDTTLACVAEGFLVYEAIRQWKRGLTAKQLAAWAEEARWHVAAQFTVDDLEFLRRGGRIPGAAAALGTKLDVKPLLGFNLDGSLAMTGIARGRKKSLKALVRYYAENKLADAGPDETVVVASADADKDAAWVEEHLERPEDCIPALRCDVGPVIGSHTGPGMVAVVFWGPDRRGRGSFADRLADDVSASGEGARA